MILRCALDDCPHLAGTTFYSVILPVVLPFWTPKKEAKKVSLFRGSRLAAHNERRHPAKRARSCATRNPRPRGCSPLGTPKRWSSAKKAKKRRSAALFLTLFRLSPIDPSGAKFWLA